MGDPLDATRRITVVDALELALVRTIQPSDCVSATLSDRPSMPRRGGFVHAPPGQGDMDGCGHLLWQCGVPWPRLEERS